VRHKDYRGYTLLHLACKNGHEACALLLLDRGVDAGMSRSRSRSWSWSKI